MTFIANPHPALAELAPNGQAKVDFLAWFNNGVVITDKHLVFDQNNRVDVLLLPEVLPGGTQYKQNINPRMVVLHTQGGPSKATNNQAWSYAARVDVVNDAHFYGPDMDTGKVIQAVPFNIKADSNFQGNRWEYPPKSGQFWGGISFETQDAGAATLNATPWTIPQLATIIDITTALCATYGIKCTDTADYRSSGISVHNRWPQWSAASHSCPGKSRTQQIDYIRAQVSARLGNYYSHVGMTCPG